MAAAGDPSTDSPCFTHFPDRHRAAGTAGATLHVPAARDGARQRWSSRVSPDAATTLAWLEQELARSR